MAHPGLQDLYGRSYVDLTYSNGVMASYGTYGDLPGRGWSVRNYIKHAPLQPALPEKLRKVWAYYGTFPSGVIAFTPESATFYHEVPVAPGQTILRSAVYRRPNETREQRLGRYLAYRIDRDTSVEDQQLSIWSNESMKSTSFAGFHLSDLEYGVRAHHDQLRAHLPVMTLPVAPPDARIVPLNEEMLRQTPIPA